VDAARIGALGMSMGGSMTLWASALEPRIKACADLCALTDYAEMEKLNALDLHGLYYYVPSLLKHFSMDDINALIAPRPHLSTAGSHDPLTPLEGLQRIQAQPGHKLSLYPCEHLEPHAMREEVLAFMDQAL